MAGEGRGAKNKKIGLDESDFLSQLGDVTVVVNPPVTHRPRSWIPGDPNFFGGDGGGGGSSGGGTPDSPFPTSDSTEGGKKKIPAGGGGGNFFDDWWRQLFRLGGNMGGGGQQQTQTDYASMISQFRPPLAQPVQPGQPGAAQLGSDPAQTQMLRDALMALLFGGRNGTV